MRFHDPLNDVLGNPVSLRVVRSLMLDADRALTSSELARRAGASTSQCIRTLGRLERVGLVSMKTVGKALVWSVVREHVLSAPLADLFRAESRVLAQLTATVERWARSVPIRSVSLFGSVARAEDTLSSDVDLRVLVDSKAARERVDEAAAGLTLTIARRYGNPLSLLIQHPADLHRLRGTSFLVSLQREERRIEVPVHG